MVTCIKSPRPEPIVWATLLLMVGCFVLFSCQARGAEPPAGSRDDVKLKARVALALAESDAKAKKAAATAAKAAGQPAPVAVAPMPREVVRDVLPARLSPAKLPYSEGYKKATVDQMPLVIFVGCDVPTPEGAIGSKVVAFGSAPVPSAVIGYPVGDRLHIDATVPMTGDKVKDETALKKAVKAAAGKIELPPQRMPGKVAPAPLDYQIRREAACCVCGPGCTCEPGKCPGGCPVAATATAAKATRPVTFYSGSTTKQVQAGDSEYLLPAVVATK